MKFASSIPDKIYYKTGDKYLTIYDEIEIHRLNNRRTDLKSRRRKGHALSAEKEKAMIIFFGSGYGEVLMSQFLISALKKEQIEVDWWVTSFTIDTTHIFEKKIIKGNILKIYEKPLINQLYEIRPTLICIMEFSYPYRMAQLMRLAAGWLKIPVIMLSAKVPEAWATGSRLTGRMLDNVDNYLFTKAFKAVSFAVTDEIDQAERLNKLHIDRDRIAIGDSLKWHCVPQYGEAWNNSLKSKIRDLWHISNDCLIIVAGSVHSVEASIILDIFCRLKEKYDVKMIFAPHLNYCLTSVKELLSQKDLAYALWSQKESKFNYRTDAIIVDGIGELAVIYKVADIAYVGGSFEPDWSGHNVIEPIFYGIPTLIGPSYENFRSIVEPLKANNGILVSTDSDDLCSSMENLIANADLRQTIGNNAKKIFNRYFNKTPLELDLMRNIISDKSKM